MPLLTTILIERFAQVGTQAETSNPIIICKFFNPCGAGTWYVSDYLPESHIAFGYVTGLGHDEWGYFSLHELEALRCPPLNLPLERDLYFEECRFSELKEKEDL